MCTSIVLRGKNAYFGRNMDIARSFGEHIVLTPRDFLLEFGYGASSARHYAMIGAAIVAGGFPLYADAVNETGLCAAGLDFSGCAQYRQSASPSRIGLRSFEVIPFVLSQCASVAAAKRLLEKCDIVDGGVGDDMPATPLHWHFADRTSSIVAEPLAEGLVISEDDEDVLTNHPPFAEQREYAHSVLSLPYDERCRGLPGGFSSQERFARAAFLLKRCAPFCDDAPVASVLSLLGSVSPPYGAVWGDDGELVGTVYASCTDIGARRYYTVTRRDGCLRCFSLRGNENGAFLKETFLPRRI